MQFIFYRYQHVHMYINTRGVCQGIPQTDDGVPTQSWEEGTGWAVCSSSFVMASLFTRTLSPELTCVIKI